MRFQVLLLFGVLQADCAKIKSLKLQRLKFQIQIEIIKVKILPLPPPQKNVSFKHIPTCLGHDVKIVA